MRAFILSRVDRTMWGPSVEIIGYNSAATTADKAHHKHQRSAAVRGLAVTGGAYCSLPATDFISAMIESQKPQYAYLNASPSPANPET